METFLIILSLICFILILVLLLAWFDPSWKQYIYLVLLISAYKLFALLSDNVHNSYKQGQIDCINGNINYELEIQEDSTKIWIKK